MTKSGYMVDDPCHVCGCMHPVIAALGVPGDPTEPCILADLYIDGDLPPSIVDLLSDSLLWCDQAGDDCTHRDSPVHGQEGIGRVRGGV